jgi:hypothetical protein
MNVQRHSVLRVIVHQAVTRDSLLREIAAAERSRDPILAGPPPAM